MESVFYLVVISQLNFIMNSKSRILPHLNLCYLQKKAYDAHCKKIDAIKHSLKLTLAKKLTNLTQSHSIDEKMSRDDSVKRMSTIKQQVSQSKLSKMRPYNRRRYLDQLKENQRLYKKIEACQSTISRRVIESHKLRSEQYKNRISKFKNDPSSHKSLLKSEHSLQVLQKLREKEKYKQWLHFHDENMESRMVSIPQIYKKQNNLISKITNLDSPQPKTQIRQPQAKTTILTRLMIRRNSQQIQSHFHRENFSFQARKKSLREEQNATGQQKRTRRQASQDVWKSRCFTTQPENYH